MMSFFSYISFSLCQSLLYVPQKKKMRRAQEEGIGGWVDDEVDGRMSEWRCVGMVFYGIFQSRIKLGIYYHTLQYFLLLIDRVAAEWREVGVKRGNGKEGSSFVHSFIHLTTSISLL